MNILRLKLYSGVMTTINYEIIIDYKIVIKSNIRRRTNSLYFNRIKAERRNIGWKIF